MKEGLDFGYPTRLWDAVDESIAHMEALDGRRVVIVFTDGDDSASRRSRNDVLDRAREKDMMIYAIGLSSEYFNGQTRVRTRPDRGLKVVAEETGGGFSSSPRRTSSVRPSRGLRRSCTANACSAFHPQRSMERFTNSKSG